MVIPLSVAERNKIYLEVATKLMDMKIWEGCEESYFDLPELKRFKVMMKLYVDYGKEFTGELELNLPGTYKDNSRKLIYRLYNDRTKKTVTYITGDQVIKARDRKIKRIDANLEKEKENALD
jgi:hypothetical protein